MSIVYYLKVGIIKVVVPNTDVLITFTSPHTDTITKSEMIPHIINFFPFDRDSSFVPPTNMSVKTPYRKNRSAPVNSAITT